MPYPYRRFEHPDGGVVTIDGDGPFTLTYFNSAGQIVMVKTEQTQFDVDRRILVGRWKAIK